MSTSLKKLNSKTWYRTLKIAFILLFILTSLLNIKIGIESGKNATLKGAIEAAQNNTMSVEDQEKLQDAIKSGKMDDIAAEEGIDISAMNPAFDINTMSENQQSNLYKYDFSKITLYIFTSLLIQLMIFEFIRRSFYYISLGQLFPKG